MWAWAYVRVCAHESVPRVCGSALRPRVVWPRRGGCGALGRLCSQHPRLPQAVPAFDFPKTPSSQNLLTLLARQGVVMTPPRNRTLPDLSEASPFQGPGLRPTEDTKGPFGR